MKHTLSGYVCIISKTDLFLWKIHLQNYFFPPRLLRFINKMRLKRKLTVYATEVEEVGSAVHLVELKAHLSLHGSDRVLPPHAQIVRIDHLEVLTRVSEKNKTKKNCVGLTRKHQRALTFHS